MHSAFRHAGVDAALEQDVPSIVQLTQLNQEGKLYFTTDQRFIWRADKTQSFAIYLGASQSLRQGKSLRIQPSKH